MMRSVFLAAVAGLLVCSVLAQDDQLTDDASQNDKHAKNGVRENLLDLGIIAGKTVKQGYKGAKPTLDSLGDSINKTATKLKEKDSVKKGLGFIKRHYDNRVKPLVEHAGKAVHPIVEKVKPVYEKNVKPVVEEGYKFVDDQMVKAKPHVEKALGDIKENGKRIMSEHNKRQAELMEKSKKATEQVAEESY